MFDDYAFHFLVIFLVFIVDESFYFLVICIIFYFFIRLFYQMVIVIDEFGGTSGLNLRISGSTVGR